MSITSIITYEVLQLRFMIKSKAADPLPTLKKNRIKIITSLLISTILILSVVVAFTPAQFNQIHAHRNLAGKVEIDAKRQQYLAIANSLISNNSQLEGLDLAAANFLYGDTSDPLLQQQEAEELIRLTDIYRFDRFKSELPFCILVQQLPSSDGFSFEFTLNSIFNQNYSNFKAVILHDPNEKNSFQAVKKYLEEHKVAKENVINTLNGVRKGILRNIRDASRKYCSPASISLNLVGGNQLLGRNVLQTFNVLYQANPVGLVYSNFYRYSHGNYVKEGFNTKFTEKQLQNIRKMAFHMSGSVTYRTDFLLDIPETEFNGQNSFDDVYEQALYFPLVERMGGLVIKVDGFHVIVNELDANYSQFLQRVKSKRGGSMEVRTRMVHKRNETYYKEAKSRFAITSFSQKYLITNPELNNISTTTRQLADKAKPFDPTPPFTLLPDYLYTRAGDRYIYHSELSIAEQKWAFELQCFDIVAIFNPQWSNQMIKYSLQLGSGIDDQQQSLEQSEYKNANKIHELEKYGQMELPFCVVIAEMPSSDEYFRFEHLLNSVFAQNYSNYFVVINNRNPMLDKYIRKYLHYYQIDRQKYVYRFTQDYKSTSLQAAYESIHKHCNPQSISIILRGWEELLVRNTLKIFNAEYQRQNKQIIFSPTCFYDHHDKVKYGVIDPPEFTAQEIKENKFRQAEKRFDFLITFKTSLFLAIEEKDLKDTNRNFYSTNLEEAIYFPLFELSCQQCRKIAGVYHFRNRDLQDVGKYVESVKDQIKKMPKYPCFETKMTTKKP